VWERFRNNYAATSLLVSRAILNDVQIELISNNVGDHFFQIFSRLGTVQRVIAVLG
jgi:hypothetical protein